MSEVAPGEVNRALLHASLRGLDLFEGVDDDTIGRLTEGVTLRRLVAGETLFSEGDPQEGMAVVLAGRFRLTRRDGSGRDRPLARVGRGEVVGEMGVLSDQPRTATATAARDSTVGMLGAELVRDVVLQRPESLLALARTLVERVGFGVRRRARARTIAVVPAGSTPPERAREVLDLLADEMGRAGSTVVVDSLAAAAATGEDVASIESNETVPPALRTWIEQVEGDNQHVLLDAIAETAWTAWSLRFADVVLIVAAADARPDPNAAEKSLWVTGETAEHVELVVVHEPSTRRPTDTAAWLADRRPGGQHHVRRGNTRDHARLSRLVTGRGIGLVLGGGGPRGFAHLGVMQALDEAGVSIDLVGGTSIGSIMGGYLALGLDHDQRVHAAVSGFTRPDLVRYTLPLVSLSSARQVTAGLRDANQFGDTMIEDLWLRYLCVSVDLVTGQEIVHERGPLWFAMRASSSLPAVFPPVMDGERLLTDGGILNNTPVDHVADRLDGGKLIAVDLEHDAAESTYMTPFPPDVSGWTVLRERLTPWRPNPRVPGPIETLLRSRSVIASRVQQDIFATTPPDLVIKPQLGPHGFVDFQTAPRFIEAGYQATLDALEDTDIAVPA